MQNVTMTVLANVLTITVDLSKDLGPSTTGKTRLIGSTQGNAKISSEADRLEDPVGLDLGSMFVGLNVYKK